MYTHVYYTPMNFVFLADRLFPIIQRIIERCVIYQQNVIKSVLNLISAIKIYFGINFLINHHKINFIEKNFIQQY